jgi:lactose/cellobiose-specific phosphotransferase system IIC component
MLYHLGLPVQTESNGGYMPQGLITHQLQALRYAFVAILPYVMVTMLGTLAFQLLKLFFPLEGYLLDTIFNTVVLLQKMLPVVLSLSIAFYTAGSLNLGRHIAIMMSVTVFVILESIVLTNQGKAISLTNIHAVLAFFTPIITCHILHRSILALTRNHRYSQVSNEVSKAFHLLWPSIIACFLSILIMLTLYSVSHQVVEFLAQKMPQWQPYTALWIKAIFSHLSWSIGIHGDHAHSMLFDRSFYHLSLQANLSYKNFYDLFVIYGGSGACLSLLISIGLFSKARHSRKIAALAAPFSLFNISELIIYGLPIVFNRHLFLPFILVPIVNLTIASAILPWLQIDFVYQNIPWTTPIFINAYLATDGNWIALLLQASLLALGVLIYRPFVSRYEGLEQYSGDLNNLYAKLNITQHLGDNLQLQHWRTQEDYARERSHTRETIELIKNNELFLVYQPIINLSNLTCEKFEVLLRLRTDSGIYPSETLMKSLEKANIATTVDWWITEQIAQLLTDQPSDLPTLSININPKTLNYDPAVDALISSLKGKDICIEIIERELPERKKIKQNIQRLRDVGFSVAMDDFGTGCANLEGLIYAPVDLIKIDREFLLAAQSSDSGLKIYTSICKLAQELGLQVVAEGVETEAQLTLVKQAGVHLVQGWYFSKAVSWDEALDYYRQNH